MKASELIDELREKIRLHGDLELMHIDGTEYFDSVQDIVFYDVSYWVDGVRIDDGYFFVT